MNEPDRSTDYLLGAVLEDLATDAEELVVLANALEDRSARANLLSRPQYLRETAALVKSAALQLGQAAANVVGASERLRLVAAFREDQDVSGDEQPS
jgi:hypothetical protein